ncbi:MAG: PIG-L family deacetylase [Anaerolineales bacterium]|nr:PIG-L family deacetylase [Anaerolineales bacterium]
MKKYLDWYNNPVLKIQLNKNSKTILAVLAHPDDETFGMGGTLALYAQRDVSVHLICGTRGEAGEVDPRLLSGFASISERREFELRCAAEKLRLTEVHFLDYRDSGMKGSPDNQHPNALSAAPVDEVAVKITNLMRKAKPQVVLTFSPNGGYGHPDHIAIQRATLRAFHLAGDPTFTTDRLPAWKPLKLYYSIMPMGWIKLAARILPLLGKDPRRIGRNQDIDLIEIIKDCDYPIHARINIRPALKSREEAAMCHSSQIEGAVIRRGPLRWISLLMPQVDYFMRAYPEVKGKLREKDLFEGISYS